ncbi:hypothetical protein [Phormidium sp. CCY1219]|uniref:hypothetical protein n=1 Tax=Phormidium sp. CCY1219 TaxID=2886104 RepID=UPI002D1F0CEB|nr:hypothetical protein [Phormidium sp. CCY1219]MEB3831458.1 hypothetical protein [Phormidium sp. CCY1219]
MIFTARSHFQLNGLNSSAIRENPPLRWGQIVTNYEVVFLTEWEVPHVETPIYRVSATHPPVFDSPLLPTVT